MSTQNSEKAITEADVLITAALTDRPARQPDLVAQNQALHALAQQLTGDPQSMLKTVVRMAQELCGADTAGVSLLETLADGTSVFRWVAIAGALESWEQTTIPGNFSPCNMTIHGGGVQLYASPELYFTYLHHPQFPIVEGLLFPICAGDRQLGTIWIISHNQQHQFDREDQRLITSLAGFCAAALQSIHLRQTAELALQREQVARLETAKIRQALDGEVQGTVDILESITDRQQAELVLVEQKRLLELTASGEPLEECLSALCASMSKLNPHVRACVLLADAQRQTFKSLIAPHLPPSFGQGLQDAPIKELAIGTCGEAVYCGHPVTCADIANDDRWSQEWRDLCVAHDVLACHSTPILGVDHLPLGSLMLCFGEARRPTGWEYRLAEFGTKIASIVLERDRASLALHESEAKYRTLTELSTHHVWMLDAAGEVVFLNQTFLDYFGKPVNELKRENWAENVHHPDDRDRVVQEIAVAMATGLNIRSEYRLRRHDNQFRWFLNEATPLRDANGKITHWLGASVDIHDSKQAEKALLSSEEQSRNILESITDAFLALDQDWLFTYVNQTAATLLYRTSGDDLIGKNFWSEFPGLNGSEFEELHRRVMNDRVTVSLTAFYPDHNRWYEAHSYPAANGITVYFRNVTESKRVEEELRQKNAILELINESAPSPIFVKDREGRMIYANPAMLEVLGKSASEVIGYRDCDLYPSPELGATIMESDRRIMASGQTEVVEESPDGIRTFLGMKTAYRNEAGVVIGLIGISYDISDRKRIEAEREQLLQREQVAREVAENANRIKDEFLAVLSHELRSPLTPILGWAKLLCAGKLDAVRTAQALVTIERNALLQSQLIEDLLDISRIMSGKLTLVPVQVDLSLVILAAIETVRLAAEAKSIHIEVNLEPNISKVYGDAGRLQQVVWNLLSNAVKFTPMVGRVKVRLTQNHQHTQLQVTDTGKGIHSEFLPYVFEHFRQEDGATTRKFGGLGLGLAIARQIAELHGGRIWVESLGENQGATFSVELPVLEAANLVEEVTVTTEAKSDDLLLANLRVLIVDDEPDSREFVAFVVKQAGAQVTAVRSAVEALQLLSTTPFDIILSDIGMPEMDGCALIREIRQSLDDRCRQMPAIALTAYAGEYEQREAIASGFQSHLTKPVDPAEIVAVVARICGRLGDGNAASHPKIIL